MADNLSFTPQVALDSSGTTIAGAQAYFFLSGTATPATVYVDTSAETVMAQPVLSDGSGVFPSVFSSGAGALRCIIRDADGVEISDIDPVATSPLSVSGAAQITFTSSIPLGLPVDNVQEAIETLAQTGIDNLAMLMPRLTKGEGVGQVSVSFTDVSEALNAPTGGTWVCLAFSQSQTNFAITGWAVSEVVGGTRLKTGNANLKHFGLFWRVE